MSKGNEGDTVPFDTNEKDLREEVNRRTAKAGYTTKLGEPTYGTKIQGLNFWGEQKLNIWPRDENGNLIND